ncbi:MAG: DNA-protecting protein DprA [Magnetococcales bacterium]|nr:DNA-protecting protein DprA [Magnetococcales bacterium]MBF0149364.1 DNA-protecting protein DprA [Magnetococcales bacterium]MBF0173010.1 DNA-protecting protein DprA [Magnetococcales bacterium]MBF0348642.1 DNA-protecting protein DprA [Magnetococcales bacterium]MBF0630927.1 DNA-protecting protein DprA [Magnetococcales bacterium]
MMPDLSPNTRAILLLTAPLIAVRGAPTSEDLLTPGEYKRLARHLLALQRQPSDLISPDAAELLHACHTMIDEHRLKRLLERGVLLSQAVEHWHARAIWVISRADADYPKGLKLRLRENAPAILYGCGDLNLLGSGGLAVVGSRHADDALIDHTRSIGQIVARFGRMLISGGARGIDLAAMRGTLDAGGNVCGVLADSLEKTAMLREHRNRLLEGRLALISPYDPNAGFNVGHAMHRNRLIYALADACLIIDSDINKGGTWTGAVEQLDKFNFIPVYVRSTGEPSVGLEALRQKGAFAWPNPEDEESFKSLFTLKPHPVEAPSMNENSLFTYDQACNVTAMSPAPHLMNTGAHPEVTPSTVKEDSKLGATPADVLFAAIRPSFQQLLRIPMKETEVAAALDITTAQAKAWLQRLVDEGMLEMRKRPVTYIVKQKHLFE